MKSFKDFLSESSNVDSLNEAGLSLISKLELEIAKKKLKVTSLRQDKEAFNKYLEMEANGELNDLVGKELEKILGLKLSKVEKNSYLFRAGNNTFVRIKDANGYDTHIEMSLFNKSLDENGIKALGKALKSLDLF